MMKGNKNILALISMAAAFSELSYTDGERKISDQEIQHRLKDLEDKKHAHYEKRMESKGLTKFKFRGEYIWALNESSARKKAIKKGLINPSHT